MLGSVGQALLSRPVVNFVLLPLLGALHGWATNTLAVWLLFRPIRPWRVPLTGIVIQGVVARRQPDMALSIGRAVESELLNWNALAATLAGPEVLAQMGDRIGVVIRDRVYAILPAWVPPAWRDGLALGAANAFGGEALPALSRLVADAADIAKERLPIARMVEERVNAFSPEDLERVVRQAARAELRSIVLLGLFMGLGIGLAQGAFLALIGQ